MEDPFQISFRDMAPSRTLEATVRRKAAKLARMNEGIAHCRIVVEQPLVEAGRARPYLVHVEMHLPGVAPAAGRDPVLHASNDNPYVAVRDAFRNARRLLDRLDGRQGYGMSRDAHGKPTSRVA